MLIPVIKSRISMKSIGDWGGLWALAGRFRLGLLHIWHTTSRTLASRQG